MHATQLPATRSDYFDITAREGSINDMTTVSMSQLDRVNSRCVSTIRAQTKTSKFECAIKS